MQTQRQSQVQRSPTERFVDLLAECFPLTVVQRVRLEDALDDVVREAMDRMEADARREDW